MKYCEDRAALLDLFVDGELPAGEMERVRAHLESCPGCQAYVDDALAIRAGFPSAEDTVVPEGFAEGVMERVRRDAETAAAKRRGLRRWTGPLAALAACCALVILIQSGGGMNSAMSGGAPPAGSDTAAQADGGMGSAQLTEAAPEEEFGRMESRAASAYMDDFAQAGAGEEGSVNEPACAPAAEAALDYAPEAAKEAGAADEEAALYLTAAEAGGLLDAFDPVREDDAGRRYELTAGEFRALLEALGRADTLPETAEGTFLVVVTGSSAP